MSIYDASEEGTTPSSPSVGRQLIYPKAAGIFNLNSSGVETQLISSTTLAAHTGNVSNPHSVTKTQVGLGNVDNTSDVNKPVSTAQAIADTASANRANHTGTQLTSTVTPSNVIGSPNITTLAEQQTHFLSAGATDGAQITDNGNGTINIGSCTAYIRGDFDISSITRTGQIATATTVSPSNYAIGDRAFISGANQPEYNSTFSVLSTPTTTSFTFKVLGSPTTPATGAPRTSSPSTTMYLVTVPAVTNMAITDNIVSHIYVGYNAGSPSYSIATSETEYAGLARFEIWDIARVGTRLWMTDKRGTNVDTANKIDNLIHSTSRLAHEDGGSITSEVGTRQISVTAGAFWSGLNRAPHAAFNTSTVDSFDLCSTADGGLTWLYNTAQTTLGNTQYNNIASGLVSLATGKYGVYWVYIMNNDPSTLLVMYGQGEYTRSQANDVQEPSVKPAGVTGVGSLIAKIVVLQGATNFASIVNRYESRFPLPTLYLDSLSDVSIGTPIIDEVLKYNGVSWVNGAQTSVSAGGSGVSLFKTTPIITAVGAGNTVQIGTMSKTAVTTTEQTVVASVTTPTTTAVNARLFDGVIDRTTIPSGSWSFNIWASIDATSGTSFVTEQVYVVTPYTSPTVTATGTGTTRTLTASSGTPFAVTKIDASATITLASYVQTASGIYPITVRTSDTVVTIATPTGYVNDSAVSFYVYKKLFGVQAADFVGTTAQLLSFPQSTQSLFTVAVTDKLGTITFMDVSTGTKTITLYYNGTAHNSGMTAPFVVAHNDLPGLQGGQSTEFYHQTASEYINSSNSDSLLTTGGSSTAFTLTPIKPISAYTDGQQFLFKAHVANTNSGSTFAVSGLGALPSTMGSVAMPIGGLIINNYYWGLIESSGTSIRISPYDSVSSNGDTINGAVTFIGNAATDGPTLGTEFLTGTGWTSTNWTGSWATGWIHTSGFTTDLSFPDVAVISTRYLITYTVTGRTVGSFTLAFGGHSSAGLTGTGAFGPTTISTANLVITPTSTFDGTIVLSIKQITAASTALQTIQTSTGAVVAQLRANNSWYYTACGLYSGQWVLGSPTAGINFTSFGSGAGQGNTTGKDNTNFGTIAGQANTTGNYNSNFGSQAGASATIASYITSLGYDANYWNISGNFCTSAGAYTGYNNVTGAQMTLYGSLAGLNLGTIQTAGAFTVGIAYTIRVIGSTDFTLIGAASNTIGLAFTATGVGAGTGTASANHVGNSCFGYNTGLGIIVGSNNTILGANVYGLAADLANNIILATGQGTIRAQFNGTNWSFSGTSSFAGTLADNLSSTVGATTAWTQGQIANSRNDLAYAQSLTHTASTTQGGVTVPHSVQTSVGIGNFSIHTEIELPDWTPAVDTMLIMKHNGTTGFKLSLQTGSTGKLQLILNAATYVSTVAPNIPDSSFHQIDVVVDNTALTATFYVDGIILGTAVTITSYTTTDNAVPLYILASSATVRYAGSVKCFQFFNKARTASTILDSYREGLEYEDIGGSQTTKVINGTFDTDTDWIKGAGVTITGGVAVFTAAGNTISCYQNCGLKVGQRGILTWTISGYVSGSAFINVGNVASTVRSANGTYTEEVVVGNIPPSFAIVTSASGSPHTFNVDNLSFVVLGNTLDLSPEGLQPDKWYDTSGNGLDATFPTTQSAGTSLARGGMARVNGNITQPFSSTSLTVSTSKPVIRATPVQRRKFIENSDGIGSSSNAFNIPQMQATIAGTRTSGTIFTRTAGTWTVSALVGQYCFSYATGVPATGIWLPITANDATTLTVSGTLNATGTSVMTCPWNPIANTYAHGQGASAYYGACFDGESIWLAPSSSTNLTKVNPVTGALTHYAHGQGATAYVGACFDGESIWLVPRASANITKVNPATGALTHYAHGQGATAYAGAVFDGESIWLVPLSSANITKVNPATGALTHYAHGQGAAAYAGACFDGESIWLAPYSSANLTKVNPATGALTHYAHGQGASAYVGACFDGESIWLAPNSSANLTKVNPATGALTHYAHGQGGTAYIGGCFDGESIWLAPFLSTNLTKVNPATGALTHYAHGQGASAYAGACFDGESIWLVPNSSANITRMIPPRAGRSPNIRATSITTTASNNQLYAGLARTMTPSGGSLVREWMDSVGTTTGNIEYGISYNVAVDPVAGTWATRDVPSVDCWLEKWSDTLATKEIWSAPAATGVPTWTQTYKFDSLAGNQTITGSLVMSSPFGLRNKVINGAMNIAQRNTTQALTTAAIFGSIDRFGAVQQTAAAGVFAQVASGLTGFQFCGKLGRTAASTNVGNISIQQGFESRDSISLQGKSVTYSFYAKAGANYSAASSTLQAYVVTGTGTDQTTASIGSWTGYAVPINITTQIITTAWVRYQYTGVISSAATQVGIRLVYTPVGTAGADDNVYITGVQLEEGTVATPFQGYPFEYELDQCQRFYEKSFPYATAPAQNTGSATGAVTATGQVANQRFGSYVNYSVRKRAIPTTLTTYCPTAATADWTTNTTTPTAALANSGEKGFYVAGTTAVTAGNDYAIHWTADADL